MKKLPQDIEQAAGALGRRLERLAFQSVRGTLTGMELRGEVSKLSARLVNEVLFVGAQLPIPQVKMKLSSIDKEALVLERRFGKSGLSADSADPLAAIAIPAERRKHLVADFDQAFLLYPKMVDRASKLGVQALTSQLGEIDREVFGVKQFFEDLHADPSDISYVDGATYSSMMSFLGSVFSVDEKLKRLEGYQRRAEATLPSRDNVWGAIALASMGLAAVGVTLKAAVRA